MFGVVVDMDRSDTKLRYTVVWYQRVDGGWQEFQIDFRSEATAQIFRSSLVPDENFSLDRPTALVG